MSALLWLPLHPFHPASRQSWGGIFGPETRKNRKEMDIKRGLWVMTSSLKSSSGSHSLVTDSHFFPVYTQWWPLLCHFENSNLIAIFSLVLWYYHEPIGNVNQKSLFSLPFSRLECLKMDKNFQDVWSKDSASEHWVFSTPEQLIQPPIRYRSHLSYL